MTERLTVAIIGAGLMGHGIAWLMAAAGHQVRVHDRSGEALSSLQGRLESIETLFGAGPDVRARVRGTDSMGDAVSDADMVIEAAAENLALKQTIFEDLEALVSQDCILASNTSSIPIRRICERVKKKARVVGTHFWNPPHLVPLVEVIQMAEENLPAVHKMIGVLAQAGRKPVHARKDVPGFIGNRLQHALKREAIAMVANGVCDAETIDDVVKYGFGSRMAVLGPLEQSDLVGLDLTRAIHETVMPDLDCTPAPHPYLLDLCESGKLGMKAGEGFRKWSPEEAENVRASLRNFLAVQAKANR
ncbi:3-hydroxyacyl-CoA dehydrogenase NAD-binding domain-containing protein [Labrenzia sp. 011]|uniref:3-hydroxyacyl-CoA dehydrogenase family protein n=1 Tax=Labrenzia sp. 011 TaxID=2171494 RepID=UPI000D506831|nr:3-hydroxyacyl-CoA dehydrogenase NAD-binding domain-containing protein [Labrenzia sp. 011]PVB62420.1 3-hydroxyacyl-CoA dehydrogenase [Labrenzia sp. 011]